MTLVDLNGGSDRIEQAAGRLRMPLKTLSLAAEPEARKVLSATSSSRALTATSPGAVTVRRTTSRRCSRKSADSRQAERLAKMSATSNPGPLWTPSHEVLTESAIARLASLIGVDDYEALWRWSVEDVGRFWALLWEQWDILADRVPARRSPTARCRAPAGSRECGSAPRENALCIRYNGRRSRRGRRPP
jgi:hypothetical protein